MAHIIIIGGGIIGLSAAYYLHREGHEVTVLDKGDITGNCSYGNAGMIVPSHFVPLAAPGMIRQGIRWMFNSRSPFYIKPAINSELIGWGLQFIKHATARHVAAAAVPLRDLSLLSRSLYNELAQEPGLAFGLQHKGILAFFKTNKAAEEEAHLVKDAAALGLDFALLDAKACRALQPDLELDVLGAVHYRCDGHLSPRSLMTTLLAYLEKNNVTILRNHAADGVEMEGGVIRAITASGKRFTADHFVLATGAWSPAVAKMLHVKAPLMPGKGYSFMGENPNDCLQIPALLCEARVAVTPMDEQIRYGGTMELARINGKVNMNRVQGIVDAIPAYFPGLRPALPATANTWFGFRPSSPDGLPYIGYSKKVKNLVLATGHGMMGLSLGPATGLLVSRLINGQPTEVGMEPFAPDRF
ncbi:FAD-dependent oxidoreductase [Chitinophaga lutea]|uniref:FAD-dependent oxidoreductase n=1 Tax=Chitinophaga lutea TaxID=2488634 RepID=A0A3N4PQ67_9BACT|nr:FAD-dependent oxidoreductase [Chitinophaga lutea]RPE08869.1 FAD-dependent oxidoreductase [Chitinophaga lutea]